MDLYSNEEEKQPLIIILWIRVMIERCNVFVELQREAG